MNLAARLVALAALVAGLTIGATQTAAQPKTGRELHEAAQKAYDVGKFAEAAELWTKAYEVDPKPGFLFNIGRSYMNNSDCKSVQLFDRFIKVAGKHAQLPMARELAEQERTRCGKKIDKAKGFGELGEKAMAEGQCAEAAGFFRDQLAERKRDDFNEASAGELAGITARIADAEACIKSTEKERKSLDAAEEHSLAGRCREAIGAYGAYLEAREANTTMPLSPTERARIEAIVAELKADPCAQQAPRPTLHAGKVAVRLQAGATVVPISTGSTTTQSMMRLGAGYLLRLGDQLELELGGTLAGHLIRAKGEDPQILTAVVHGRLGYLTAAQMTFGVEASGGMAGALSLAEGNPFVVKDCNQADPDCTNASDAVWMPYFGGGVFIEFAVTRKLLLGVTATVGYAQSSSPEIDLTPLVNVTGGVAIRL